MGSEAGKGGLRLVPRAGLGTRIQAADAVKVAVERSTIVEDLGAETHATDVELFEAFHRQLEIGGGFFCAEQPRF